MSLSAAQKNLKEKPKEVAVKQKDEPVAQKEVSKPELAEQFDSQKLQIVLNEAISNYKNNHKNLETTVLKQPVTLEGEAITFQLNGEIQQDIFLKIKPELLQFLRRKLNNYSIALNFVIEEKESSSSRKLYTSTDKLNYLKEKSPALAELQRRFGLETDF